ncbi:hypothetical protein BC834DRAFT_887857 [Gloeopeniophorella convolvens]|nr:hypothetical protein BC834DRAFT_887857 [Gloeopeniophorella convolvens]
MSTPPTPRRSRGAPNKERPPRRANKRDQVRSTTRQAGVPAKGLGGQGSPSGPAGKSAQIHLTGDLGASPSEPRIPVRTDTRDHHARAALRAIVEKQIDDAERGILSMRTRRNALVPISILPPELLARIFHLHALDHPPLMDGKSLGWIADTHVCQHWRQVALGDGSLWGDIKGFPTKNKWIPEMVARSKDAPLNVSLKVEPLDKRLLSMFLRHLPRIRELALPGLSPSQAGEGVIRKILTHEAPILERFTLRSPGDGKKTSPIVPNEVGLFRGHGAPRLREVTLYGVNLPWSSFSRSPLTHLDVRLSPGFPSMPSLGGIEHLMGVLTGCPTLELLSLHHCLPSTPSTLDQTSTVDLPKLQRLALTDTSNEITRMLEHLKLPPSSSLDIRCVNPSPTQGNPTSVLSFIAAHFARPGAVTLRSLYVTHHMFSTHVVEITAYGTLPGPEGHPSHDSNLNLQFEVEHDPSMLSGIVQRTFAALPFADVEYYYALASEELRPLDWSQLRHRCSKITNMRVMGRGATALLKDINPPKAVVPRPSSSNTASCGKGKKKRQGREAPSQAVPGTVAQPVPFPKLASLYVRDIDFSQQLPGGDGTIFNIIKNAMDRRKQRGIQLRKLEISGCVITANQARQLGKFVREFEWDEDEGQPEHPGYPTTFNLYADDSDWDEEGPDMTWEDFLMDRDEDERVWLENYSD